ncbi:MAG: hypothetical protein IJ657_01405 [Acidaminococcaceae bacterium]|nr:hypothetical protein [Acidaminococcaceae bacterium]
MLLTGCFALTDIGNRSRKNNIDDLVCIYDASESPPFSAALSFPGKNKKAVAGIACYSLWLSNQPENDIGLKY